jgi:hypothetical protein
MCVIVIIVSLIITFYVKLNNIFQNIDFQRRAMYIECLWEIEIYSPRLLYRCIS